VLLPVCPRCGCCPPAIRVGGRCPACGATLAAGALAGIPPDPQDGDPRPPPSRRERIGIMIGALVGIALGLAAALFASRAGKPEAVRYAVAVGLIAGLAGGGVMGAVLARLTGRGV
jgi:hypothetical protein